jgi:Rrf2 family protein
MLFSAFLSRRDMLPLPFTAEYALRAVLRIAREHPRPVRVAEVAAAVGAPPNYLSKTLGQLARAGVLSSLRGRNGGFRLVEAPDAVTLDRVVAVFRDRGPARCLLGGLCGDNADCPVHTRWQPIASRITSFFQSTTVADLAHAEGAAAVGHAVFSTDALPFSSRSP